MESVLGRYRNLIILVGVLFLQVLGLAVQVKKSGNDEEKTRLIRIWAVDAVTPFERALVWVERGSGNLWHNYFYLRGVRAENRQLKDEIEQMRLQQVRLADDAAQARRLQTLLSFKEQFISRTVAAQVIGSSGSDHSRIIYIDKGENAGIQRDMAVMTSDGIVGKVLLVFPSVAQVLLINDESSGVGAMLEKTRLQGVLRGTTNGEVVLERVMSDEQVPVGETVLTSGGDQIFPKGLPVGTVTKVSNGRDLFLNIKIKPAADLSKLEEVLVLVEKQERTATAEDAVHLRASDILSQRLPSVPDKPAADAKSAAAILNNGAAAGAPPAKPASNPTITATPKPQGTEQSLTGSAPAGSVAAASTKSSSVAQSGVAKTGTTTTKTGIVQPGANTGIAKTSLVGTNAAGVVKTGKNPADSSGETGTLSAPPQAKASVPSSVRPTSIAQKSTNPAAAPSITPDDSNSPNAKPKPSSSSSSAPSQSTSQPAADDSPH
jgi:rod shape-determining protein MreC